MKMAHWVKPLCVSMMTEFVPWISHKNGIEGVGEMVQWLRGLAVIPEDLGSLPSTRSSS